MIFWTASAWSLGRMEVPPESPMRRQQWITDTFLLGAASLLIPSAFPRCAVSCVAFEILTVPSCFSSGFCAASCYILFFSDLSCTALYCSVVWSCHCSDNASSAYDCAWGTFSAESPSGRRTQSWRYHKWIFRQTEKCRLYKKKTDASVLESIRTREEGGLVQYQHRRLEDRELLQC